MNKEVLIRIRRAKRISDEAIETTQVFLAEIKGFLEQLAIIEQELEQIDDNKQTDLNKQVAD